MLCSPLSPLPTIAQSITLFYIIPAIQLRLHKNLDVCADIYCIGSPFLRTIDGGKSMVVSTRIASVVFFMAAILFFTVESQAQPVQNGFAAVTCYSNGSPSDPVVALIDVRLADLQPFNVHWPAPKSYGPVSTPWNKANLGEVFGIAFDLGGNIYVSATAAYTASSPGGPGGDGAIYQLNSVTGNITTFVSTLAAACGSVIGTNTIPNTGNGLGNIAYDAANNQFFVTNMEDGMIYRIDAAGIIQSTFDPFGADGCVAGPVPHGERLWGIGVYNNRVYFSRWQEDCGSPSGASANEIYSVALAGGDFSGSETLEITLPTLPGGIHSNPVADIAFSQGGRMLLAERTMRAIGANPFFPNAHASRVLEYEFTGSWTPLAVTYDIGVPASSSCGSWPGGNNAAGGVDYTYDSFDPTTGELINCDSAIWASGDALKFSGGQIVYGFQRTPTTGGNPTNSQLIDADGNIAQGDKTQIGDIEIYKRCTEPQTDPCKDVRVSFKPIQVQGESGCCFDLNITGLSAGAFTQVEANLLTASVSFTGVIGPSGWNVTNTGTQATWDSAGMIPAGTVAGLQFCIYSLVGPPQEIEIVLYAADGSVCRDTIRVDCPELPPPFPPCVTFADTTITCKETGANGSVYDLSFTVTNHSLFSLPPYNLPAENVVVYPATSGVNVVPGSVALSPTLGHGQTSGPLNFTISGSGAMPGDTVYIVVQLHGKQLPHDYQWCCPPDTLCIVLPPCKDCCDSVDIAVKEGRIRQIGNNAANISSSITVAPGPVMGASATIMSVTRSDVWCPKFVQGAWTFVPVATGGPMLGQITNGTISPSLPLSSGISPPTSEVSWGTVPAGVDMSSGTIGLQLSFPGTTLGWRCRDTLTVCVRYTFTDTACRTCDTVVYYRIPRRGQIDIIGVPVDLSGSKSRVGDSPLFESGTTVSTNALYEGVAGPGISIEMTNVVGSVRNGVLSLEHWWQDDLEGEPTIQLQRMYVTPEPGIEITALNEQGGGALGSSADRTMAIDLDLNKGEIDLFNLQVENPTSARAFVFHIQFDYVETEDQREPERSREYLLVARVPGETGGDLVLNDDISERPVGVRTFMLYFVNNNLLKQPVSQIRLSVAGEESILAAGPSGPWKRQSKIHEVYIRQLGDSDNDGDGIDAAPANHNTTRSNRHNLSLLATLLFQFS